MTVGTMRRPLASWPTDGGRPATGSEHPFESTLVESGRPAEVVDDLDDAAPDHDVAQQLGDPGVDLVVALVGEPGAVFGRIGGQAGG